jgi:hypothetical protein
MTHSPEHGVVATPAPAVSSLGIDWENPEHPAVKLFVGFDVEGYVEEYELCGEDGDYSPNEQERVLLVDAIYGVVSNLHEELRKLIPSSSPPADQIALPHPSTLSAKIFGGIDTLPPVKEGAKDGGLASESHKHGLCHDVENDTHFGFVRASNGHFSLHGSTRARPFPNRRGVGDTLQIEHTPNLPTPASEENLLVASSEVHPYAPERQSGGGQPDQNDSQQPRPTNWALASTVSERSELEHKGSWNQSDSQSDPERHDQQIVKVAKDWDEVRDQVDRREGVGGHAACNDLRHDRSSFVTGSEPEGYDIAFQRTCPVLQPVQPSIHDLAYTRGEKSGPASQDSLYTPAPHPNFELHKYAPGDNGCTVCGRGAGYLAHTAAPAPNYKPLQTATEEAAPAQNVLWTSPGQLREIERGGNGTVTKHGDEFMCVPLYVGTPSPAQISRVAWRPIAEADKGIAYIHALGPIKVGNSYPIWARDADGRVFECLWADDGKRAYWWDSEAESPVDPVEFMPHPLSRTLAGGA